MLQCWYFYFSVYDDDDDDDNHDEHYPILTHKIPYVGFWASAVMMIIMMTMMTMMTQGELTFCAHSSLTFTVPAMRRLLDWQPAVRKRWEDWEDQFVDYFTFEHFPNLNAESKWLQWPKVTLLCSLLLGILPSAVHCPARVKPSTSLLLLASISVFLYLFISVLVLLTSSWFILVHWRSSLFL